MTKKLVIVGGGFCGTFVAASLDKKTVFNITLIDKKDYFSFTPALPKLIADSLYKESITIPYSQFLQNTRIITENVKQITPKKITTENHSINYDYLVISTGSNYPIFLNNTNNVYTVTSVEETYALSKKITKARDILIIGGGLIGTEAAAEIATKLPDKHVTLVHSSDRIIERNPPAASQYAKKFLEKHGVSLIFNEKIIRHHNKKYITESQKEFKADIGIWCAGIQPNTGFMKEFDETIFSKNNSLRVNPHLQLQGYPNVFAGGDITSIQEEKTAQNARRHANTIKKNLLRMIKRKPLTPYWSHRTPLIISLGDRNGIISIPPIVIPGILPALGKLIVEKMYLNRFQ